MFICIADTSPKNIIMLTKEMYEQLGRLFYAVAAIDRSVKEKEVAELNRIVQEEWVPAESHKDAFGTDIAYQIEIVFDWLLAEDTEAEACWQDFRAYHDAHPALFTPALNALIIRTVDSIAHAFSGVNKAESQLLHDIHVLLGH